MALIFKTSPIENGRYKPVKKRIRRYYGYLRLTYPIYHRPMTQMDKLHMNMDHLAYLKRRNQ